MTRLMTRIAAASLRRAALTALLLAAATLAAHAQTQPSQPASEPTEEQRQACTADFRRLCPGTRPGGGRVKQCFHDHYAALSPACKMAVDTSGAAAD